MTLDEALSQPLEPVRDGGFSVKIILAMRRAEERRRLLLWGAAALALLPPLAFLPLLPGSQAMAAQMARALSSPVIAYAAGAAVLLWTWRPLRLRF